MFQLDVIFNLSIIIPALVGIYVFSSVKKEYRYFIVTIIAGTLNEYNAEFNIVPNFIFNALHTILYVQFFLLLYFKWDLEKIAKAKKIVLHASIFILLIIDEYYDYLSIYHIKWASIACEIGISFYGIRLLSQIQNNLINEKEKYARRLIIIPYLVFSTYYAAINILMYYLFDKSTRAIFEDLYNVIRWINFLSYISYTLALLWAPKKEKFL
jgi:hypothetical protein